jgi:hypothetical protein
MRKTILTIAALLLLLPIFSGNLSALAQEEQPVWTGAVGFPSGIYVRTGHGTIPPGATDLRVAKRIMTGGQQSASPDNTFRRILTLADGRAIIYEVSIKPLADRSRFEVKLSPVTPTAAQAKEWGVDPLRVETNFLKNYAAPLTVKKGDTLAIDSLINPQTGVKLVDYYLINDKPVEERRPDTFAASARQFKVEEVELSVFKYELRVNGETVYKSDGGFRGRFIWVDIPRVGRFLFTLAQAEAEAAGFHPTAYVSEHQIVFTHAGDRYELLSEQPIAPGSGVFYLWMLHDSTFSIPSRSGLPAEFSGEPGRYGRFGAADNLHLKKKE